MPDSNKVYKIGDLTVTKIEEQVIPGIPPGYLYPKLSPQDFAAIEPALAPHDLGATRADVNISVHTWLVRTPKHIILVDTSSGNHKDHPQNPLFHQLNLPYLQRLADAGVRPEDVDYVFNTHLHVDHVGWNTVREKDKWIPTFPNARYLIPSVERDYYSSPASHNEANIPSLGTYEDSVLPVIEAGLVDSIGPDGGPVLDYFTFVPTPGHSIGHMSIEFSSNGDRAIFAGDVMHSPIQVVRPDINSVFCEFLDQATESRRKILDHVAQNDALYFGTHFAGRSVGRITRNDGGYLWIPE
ncbi:glyoxylase-like metal-dependent hydrolase (beta-lactamase superfamily II) [Roseiarcus fermentans]|uniref:Glyoxylase-like metal-dependent hydrolase (Beta-lactamase superfamily II) n=1 Tax=Roseiarcus fermentans TaxID=1473586 RepID=A0A366FSS3_9HYPH|nr:MBL fold metallo-hydrolase [Roseiarcus fermentans]RBP16795.1 glyoxylase-like metal-dependent hydrolase (beta-lactamase superfamily II) [Roseiarcus fermentans]